MGQDDGKKTESLGDQKEDHKCEFCEEQFDTVDAMKVHINHAHYRDTYKPTDRERRLWAKHCLSATREHKRVGKKEMDSLVVDDDSRDADYQEE